MRLSNLLLILLIVISFISCKPDNKSVVQPVVPTNNISVNDKGQKTYDLALKLEEGNYVLIYALQLESTNRTNYDQDSIDLIRHDVIYQSSGRGDRNIDIVVTDLEGGKFDIRFKDTYTHSLKLSGRDSVTDVRISKEIPMCKEEHNPFLVVNYKRTRDRKDLAYTRIIGYIEYEPSLDINFDAYFDRQSNLYNFYHTAVNDIRCGLQYEFD